jgi:hypothetical protein
MMMALAPMDHEQCRHDHVEPALVERYMHRTYGLEYS